MNLLQALEHLYSNLAEQADYAHAGQTSLRETITQTSNTARSLELQHVADFTAGRASALDETCRKLHTLITAHRIDKETTE